MSEAATVRTCLWFDRGGLDAARFYVGAVPGSRLETETPPDGREPQTVRFHLAGAPYMILNGGPLYRPSPAASIVVVCEDQDQTNRLWALLTSEGGVEGRCGWLTDRFGVSWQIVPKALPALLGDNDAQAAARVREAFMRMTRIDIAELEAARGLPDPGGVSL